MIELITDPASWSALITLAMLEIVLGVDNIVMIAILVSALPKEKQQQVRRLGIGFALLTRIGLLFTMSWLAGLTEPLFSFYGHFFSIRDLVMLIGGVFLIYKGFKEVYEISCEDCEDTTQKLKKSNVEAIVILQIGIFDIVFSIDSVITAVGMSNQMPIMVSAICIAMFVMLFASKLVMNLTEKYVSIKVLALCFIILVGVVLTFSGFGIEIKKAYIYAAMGFSTFVQIMIIMVTKKQTKVIV